MNIVSHDSAFDFDRVFDGFFTPSQVSRRTTKNSFSPKVDIKLSGDNYVIITDLPGVKKDNLEVTIDDGILNIEANVSNTEVDSENEKVIRQERFTGSFSRSFNLGTDIQESKVTAKFEDGVLILTVPKVKETTPQKLNINIQ